MHVLSFKGFFTREMGVITRNETLVLIPAEGVYLFFQELMDMSEE